MPLNESFTQEGQIKVHKIRMFLQVLRQTWKAALWMGIGAFILGIGFKSYYEGFLEKVWFLGAIVKIQAWHDLQVFLAELFSNTTVTPELGVTWLYRKGSFQSVSDVTILDYAHTHQAALWAWLQTTLLQLSRWSLLASSITLVGIVLYLRRSGHQRQEAQVLQGATQVSASELKRHVKKVGASKIRLASIPLPRGAECEHLLITGSTGTGKTNALYHLLKQIRALGHKAIIVDSSGSFVERFFDPRQDVLLNPFDQRTQHWNLWKECHQPYEFEELAESFIPETSRDPFWNKAAQQLFAVGAQRLAEKNKPTHLSELLKLLLVKPFEETFSFFEGSPAAAYVDPTADKTVTSLRASLASDLKSLHYVAQAPHHDFSVREWMQHTDKGCLFLASTPTQRQAIRPLMSAWLSIAVKALMNQGENLQRRVWFILDELASLNKIPILASALAESRRFGGCFALAFQDINQLHAIYGLDTTRTLLNLLRTKLVFSLDSDTAQKMSQLLGTQDIHASNRSVSFGAHEVRDGVSLTDQIRKRPVVSPEALMALSKREAYLKLSGSFPIAKVAFPLEKTRTVAPAFVPTPNTKPAPKPPEQVEAPSQSEEHLASEARKE